jgi:cytochrome bd-type quinol oxidase subunit 2
VTGFFDRWGLAVAAPRRAMAIADQPDHAGRASGDLLRAIGVLLLVAQTRVLVGAAWIAVEVGPMAALPRLLRAVSGAAMLALVFVVVAAVVVTIAAGRRRSLSADFELACVAALAPVTVAIGATVVVAATGGPGAIGRAIALAAALGWGGALAAIAIVQARRRR